GPRVFEPGDGTERGVDRGRLDGDIARVGARRKELSARGDERKDGHVGVGGEHDVECGRAGEGREFATGETMLRFAVIVVVRPEPAKRRYVHQHDAAWSDDAGEFAEGGGGVLDLANDVERDYCIEGAVGKRQREDRSLDDGNVGPAAGELAGLRRKIQT